ncbi:MAG: DUF1631 domain-containing protein, partial [Burkholderiales bacterium]|nr:DUF1631 domain-containing protein [Burkholderiales bacterium]
MAIQSFDNVISIGSAQVGQAGSRWQTVKPESVAVINDCRDIAVKRITEVLAKTFDTIEKELFDLAEKSMDREKQNFYLDARTQARDKRAAIEASFRKQFLSVFEKKISCHDEQSPKSSRDFGELSLVEDNELEEKLAMNDIATRLSGKCDEELNALSQRMGFLLSVPEMKEQANPMSPDTVVKALRTACDQMASAYEAKLAVMKLMEQHIAKEMLGMYQDINAHLITRQILPQIRPTFRRAQTNVKRKVETSVTPSSEGGIAPESSAKPAADIFATLQQLLAGGKLFDTGMSAGMAAPPSYGVTTGSFAPVPPDSNARAAAAALGMANILDNGESATTAGLVSALSHIQLQASSHAANFISHLSMNHCAPGDLPLVPQNAVREIKASGLAGGSSPVDAMTIDIVAMLFDYVFEDKGIPDAIKALLARLQIPVLKVAILDKSFFSRKNHPARRLLDLLADASVSFVEGATHEDPLYKKTQEIVDCIQGEFDTDIQIFSQMLAGFEQFLSAREAANANTIEQSARVLHEREKRELARLIAQDETERRASGTELPPAVSAMLTGPWTRVLERVYLREGGRNSGFAAALETADNLIWSVTPKTDASQRKQLVSLLPALLKQLQDGMQIAAVEKNDCDRFFSTLVDCHAAAVRAGLRGESVSALLISMQTTAEVAPLFAKLIAEEAAHAAAIKNEAASRAGLARIQFTGNGVEIEEIMPTKSLGGLAAEASGRSNAGGINFDIAAERPSSVTNLERGTWVEFVRESGEKIRAELSWISPLKGVY